MDLRRKIVERADGMAVPQQRIGEMRSDEPGTAGDEDVHGEVPKCKLPATTPSGRWSLARKRYLPSVIGDVCDGCDRNDVRSRRIVRVHATVSVSALVVRKADASVRRSSRVMAKKSSRTHMLRASYPQMLTAQTADH